jgi:hypothetical protein
MRTVSIFFVSLLLFGTFGLVGYSFGAAQYSPFAVFTIPTREGVTVKSLLVPPNGTMKAVLMMFVGDTGLQAFGQQGDQISYTASFMSRTTPLFLAQGYAVLLINAPSDHPTGMSRAFRQSSANAQDISMIIDFLLAKSLKPTFLVGTSLGTMSVLDFASTFPKDTRLSGLVLTSTVSVNLPVQNIALPVLFVHNVYDDCSESPFQTALDFSKQFTTSSKVDFIKFQDKVNDAAEPCGPLSGHGYSGIENQVVKAIIDWTSQVISLTQSQAIIPTGLLIAPVPDSIERIKSEILSRLSQSTLWRVGCVL